MTRSLQSVNTHAVTEIVGAILLIMIALIASAESHQIDSEDDVQHFIELFFDRSPDSFQDPEVNAILKANDVSSSTKIAFLDDILSSNGIPDV